MPHLLRSLITSCFRERKKNKRFQSLLFFKLFSLRFHPSHRPGLLSHGNAEKKYTKRRRGHRRAEKQRQTHSAMMTFRLLCGARVTHTRWPEPASQKAATNLDLNISFIVIFHNSKCHFRISSRCRGITQIVAPPDQEEPH